jgi:UDP-glucose 4-epimerase
MRVVVLGASGFIGSAVVNELVARSKEVCVLVRPNSKLSDKFSASINTIVYHSLADELLLERLRGWKPEIMINLAWKGVDGNDRVEASQFDNISFILQSVKLAFYSGCRQWVGAGSQAEYGIASEKISEETPCNPITAYGKAKLAAGIASLGLCDSLNIVGTWARIFSVYGPADHPNTFINYTIKSLLSNKSPILTACIQKWDYVFITDAAEAIVSLIENNCKGVYNIGSGNIIVLKDVVEYLKRSLRFEGEILLGKKEYPPHQIMHLQADVNKLKQHTGWKPTVSIKQGLKKTVSSIQENFSHESI